ncbi:pilus assembly protein CpaF [Microbacterium endophyticum]|uniref:Pilus assembly protein CpaF n=1 Tax=Microbacterium endophyticum TaxID=1526412 RepID=A0A7W4V1Q6_9MICO|nr:TadA family conjugal transfer-associated ATPase [Microbacterium endophyticum]MBB2975134.1 pilus assembly protein CpaF [Microbacterium endophyticum]NIK37326.1 pilus assembly protein CpaF [Microbacterium endophyticum]
MPQPFVVQPRMSEPAISTHRRDVQARPKADRSQLAELPALRPLAQWLCDPDTTDVFVNGADGLFVDRGNGAERVPQWRASADDVRELAVALIGLGGRHLDDATPCADVRLESGMRVHAVLAPVAPAGATISIRVPRFDAPDLDELQRRGAFDAVQRAQLEEIVARRQNVLITGSAGSGKTTLLAAMLQRAVASDRIVTIEDVAELAISHPHHVRLEARQSNLEGAGGVGLAQLVREALRMRPDRLVVGECRGAEVRELLSALNTGHDGGAGTLHANSLRDVPARLEALGSLAGLDDRALARQAASGLDTVIHLERTREGLRRIAGFGAPAVEDGRLVISEER